MICKVEIPYEFPSFNAYIDACRRNAYAGASMKKKIQRDISPYFKRVPKFANPIHIRFLWVEKGRRKDPDNICYAKKFILDALVTLGKIKDDGMRYVTGFEDAFEVGKETKVILYIEEE